MLSNMTSFLEDSGNLLSVYQRKETHKKKLDYDKIYLYYWPSGIYQKYSLKIKYFGLVRMTFRIVHHSYRLRKTFFGTLQA